MLSSRNEAIVPFESRESVRPTKVIAADRLESRSSLPCGDVGSPSEEDCECSRRTSATGPGGRDSLLWRGRTHLMFAPSPVCLPQIGLGASYAGSMPFKTK